MSEANIYLFIPNIIGKRSLQSCRSSIFLHCYSLLFALIGYVRAIFIFTSFFLMPTNYYMASSLYLLSVLFDEFDGLAARRFNQGKNV